LTMKNFMFQVKKIKKWCIGVEPNIGNVYL